MTAGGLEIRGLDRARALLLQKRRLYKRAPLQKKQFSAQPNSIKIKTHSKYQHAEAEVVPSSSLVEIKVEVEVGVWG